jgi:hypothetical protein
MSYKPETFHYIIDEKGDRKYDDHILNVLQQNLLTISQLIDDIKTDADINILYVQNWANCKTVKDSTVQTIAFFASKIIEGLGVVFTAGTAAAIIATLACKIISGLITHFSTPTQKDSYNQLQSVASDLKLSLEKYCYLIQTKIAVWLDDLELEWNFKYHCPGAKHQEFMGPICLSDLAIDDFLPKKSSTDYVYLREKMSQFSTYESSSALIPVRWRIRRHRAFPADGISNFISGWNVSFYKVRSRGTWDSWRSSNEFPRIPANLSDDIEGPLEYTEKGDNAHAQRFMSWYQSYTDYSWSDGSQYDESRDWGGSRWMGFSGKHGTDHIIDKDDNGYAHNLIQGTSFLDLIDDILSGYYNAYGDWSSKNSLPNEPSYYLWYKTKRPGEGEIINDRRVWTLMGNEACQDWAYDSYDIFHWGRAYRGITLNHYSMVDENGNYAPKEFCNWLFKDNGHGKIKNEDGVAEIGDVYHNWGLSFE